MEHLQFAFYQAYLELNCHHHGYNLVDFSFFFFFLTKWDSFHFNNFTYLTTSLAQLISQPTSFKEQGLSPMYIQKYELFLVLVCPRFVALTIRPMLAPVICLLPSVNWKGPKKGTNYSWIILEPANVRFHHYSTNHHCWEDSGWISE